MTKKRLVLIHGADAIPDEAHHRRIWRRALAAGIERDRPDASAALKEANVEFVFFGDLINPLAPTPLDPELDLADRELGLAALTALKKSKNFRRRFYEELPGASGLSEFVARALSPLTNTIGVGKKLIARRQPELAAYLDEAHPIRTHLDARCTQALTSALAAEDSVCVLGHCLGSVVAYNSLWQLSQGSAALPAAGRKVDLFLTLGSALADNSIRNQLQGFKTNGSKQFPTNLVRWHNVAAKDDPVCHDETVGNDFQQMLKNRQIAEITDHQIYNHAVRYGRSDPHDASGYLIHPKVAGLLADWLLR